MGVRDRMRILIDFNQGGRDAWVAKKAATLSRGTKVLDAGAGTCRYRSLFRHCDYVAQDFCALGEESGGYENVDLVSDICAIPLPDASVDVILCTEVLEHLPDPVGAVAEFSRLLKSEGLLWLTVPLGSGLHQQPYHFYGGFTPHWFRRVLPVNGFDIVSIEPNGGFFKWYGQETARMHTLLFSKDAGPLRRALLWPLKAITFPFLRVGAPLLFGALDRLDREKAFTVGYFVEAVRQPRIRSTG